MTKKKYRIYYITTEGTARVFSHAYIKIPESVFEKYKHLSEEDVVKVAYTNEEFIALCRNETVLDGPEDIVNVRREDI